MDKKEVRVLIKHCFLMGKNTIGVKEWLDNRYGDSTPGNSIIIDWYAQFKRDRTNTDDAERSSRPKSAVVPENITKVYEIVFGDRKLTLHEIANTLKISKGSMFRILHESSGVRKLFPKCVPRLLTPDQTQKRFEYSEHCLELFKRGPYRIRLSFHFHDRQRLMIDIINFTIMMGLFHNFFQ